MANSANSKGPKGDTGPTGLMGGYGIDVHHSLLTITYNGNNCSSADNKE